MNIPAFPCSISGWAEHTNFSGGHIVGETPDTIPNLEAKPLRPMAAKEIKKSKCKM
jgi:hypothetical protein